MRRRQYYCYCCADICDVARIAQACTALTELDLSECGWMEGHALSSLPAASWSLYISDIEELQPALLMAALPNLRGLEHSQLNACSLPDDGMNKFTLTPNNSGSSNAHPGVVLIQRTHVTAVGTHTDPTTSGQLM